MADFRPLCLHDIASTPTHRSATSEQRRRPVWAKCFDQSSVEARPIDQYRPPERTGFEILREIARGTPRFCEIARTNQQIPFWQLGGGPIVFQLLSVISPPHVPRRNGTQKGVHFLRLKKWVERGSDFSVASNCELISGKRWFVVAFSGRTSPLFHFYSLRREMGRPKILVRRSVLLPEGRRTVGSY